LAKLYENTLNNKGATNGFILYEDILIYMFCIFNFA
jgi:hypothetical protein